MDIEWDPVKAGLNEQKHGVSFSEAAAVLDDPMALVAEDDRHMEQRFQTIGADAMGRVLTVIFVYRGDRLRIVSARRSERWERQLYEG